jgi:ABC-type antimicrobial peptide transport system permease subunit
VGVGLIAAALASRALERFLYGVTPTDGLAFVAAAGAMILAALAACALPAHRALKMDPALAMRTE